MKTFKKVLASALAAAMVVTAFPVTNAEAASTAKLNKTKATVYAGQSTTLKVTTPKAWKSVKVTASKKGAAAKITKVSGKKVTVKAVKAGTAKVTVKVTAKKAGKKVSKTLKATVTVKNPSLTLKAANEVAVGATEPITATVKPANTKVTFTSSDETIAKVDEKGVVTGVKAGEVTITAKAGKTTKTVTMSVKNVILKDVKQASKNTITATITGKTADIKASDVVVTNTATSIVNAVKSVTVDKADASKVTIETFAGMTDAKTYTVALDGVTKEFTATNGVVSTVSIDTVTIPYGVETEIEASAKDANGVVLESFKYSQAPTGYDFTIETTNGYTSGTKLYLVKKDDTAKAKIVAHSGKYDANGVETGNITAEATITAVDPEVVTVNKFQVRVNKAADKTFDTVADNTKVAVGDSATAYFKIMNSKDKEIADADYSNYTVETSNKDVMIISALSSKKLTITPVATGTAYLVIKDAKANVVATVAINIVAKREAASLVLDQAAFDASTKVDNAKVVKVSLKDQYGDDMDAVAEANITVECVAASGTGATKETAPTATKAEGKVTFDATASTVKAGVYTYTIKVGKLTKTVVVTAKTPDDKATSSYSLVLDNTTMDAVVKSDKDTDKKITIKVAELKGGVVNSYVDKDFTITVTDKDNKDVSAYADGTLQVTKKNSGVVDKLAAGTYTVTAKKTIDGGKELKLTRSIVITDSQATVTAERIADETTSTEAIAIAATNFKYVYDGKVYTAGDLTGKAGIIEATAAETVPGSVAKGNVFFKNATVKVPVADALYISVKVDLNKTITVK